MKHRQFGKKLGRNRQQRQALFRTQLRSLFLYGRIDTTDAKTKALIPLAEKVCHRLATENIVIAQRYLSRYLQDKKLVSRIYKSFTAVFAGQTSNFTKTHFIKFRQGDNALITRLTFVKPFTLLTDQKEVPAETKKPTAKKTTIKVKKVTPKTKK